MINLLIFFMPIPPCFYICLAFLRIYAYSQFHIPGQINNIGVHEAKLYEPTEG